jgi:hypothetical protein
MPYQVIWTLNGVVVPTQAYMSVGFPSLVSGPVTLTVASPAGINNTKEILTNIQFFLDGPDADLLQSWTTINSIKTTLNGGVEISFDGGLTWSRFNATTGLKSNKATWVQLPGAAISEIATDGTLTPNDSGTILLRLVIPPSFSDYRVISFLIGTDFDVV